VFVDPVKKPDRLSRGRVLVGRPASRFSRIYYAPAS
jgi:hypothetical protein